MPVAPVRPPLRHWAIGIAAALIVLVLQWATHRWLGNRTFLFALAGSMYVAFALGPWPASFMLILGGLDAFAGLTDSVHGADESLKDRVALLAYVVVGGGLLLYGQKLRVATARAGLAERRLQVAQENTDHGVYEFDFRSGLAFVSPGLCRLLEQPVQHGPIPLERWFSMLPSATVEETRQMLQAKVSAGELSYEREQRIVLASGQTRWFLARVRLSVSPSGELASALGATIDITERKHTDELLQQTQSVLRQQLHDLQRLQAFSHSLVTAGLDVGDSLSRLLRLLVEFHDAERGLILWSEAPGATSAISAHVGIDADTFAQLSVWSPGHLEVPWSTRVVIEHPGSTSGRDQPEQAWMAACGAHAAHATALRDTSGRVRGSILVMFDRPHRPDDREIRLSDICAGIAAAVLERDQAVKLAAENEQRCSVTLESSTVPFAILAPVRDADGLIVDFRWRYANPAAARALRFPIEALVGERMAERLPGIWDEKGPMNHYIAAVEQGTPCEFELQSRLRPEVWFQVIATPLKESVAVWFADISNRKRDEQALKEADRRKDEFLATLAHELRNPLAPIRQAAALARSPACDERRRAWSLDVIDRQVGRMAFLLEDLLDVSRISRGAVGLRRAPVALSELFDSALEATGLTLDAGRHELTVDLPPTSVELDVDALRMSQALANLLTNAAKFTNAGGRIRLSAALESGGGVRLSVADDGIGLAPEQRLRIFEMFSQVPDAQGRSRGGLGIGLALARGFVTLHGGTLDVASDGLGTGSEFAVRLPPTCVIDAAAPAANESAAVASTDPERGRRVLVADDNLEAADTLVELLRMEGHDVEVSHDGAQAVAAFEKARFDLVILDIGMPVLDGHQAAAAIRALPHGSEAVLIALTGWGLGQDKVKALEAGFDHHVTKPAAPEALLALFDEGRALA